MEGGEGMSVSKMWAKAYELRGYLGGLVAAGVFLAFPRVLAWVVLCLNATAVLG